MVQPYRPKPSLDNAFARVSRAEEHLQRLEIEIVHAFPTPPPDAIVSFGEPMTVSIEFRRKAIPPIIGILVGECIYNLRAALDYLIYELALLDSGRVQEGTQFPIEDSPEGWKVSVIYPRKGRPRGKEYLFGLSVDHKAAIKRLQPCDGCDWTKTLRDISNPDKHKSLAPSYVRHTFTPGQKQATVPGLELPMNVDTKPTTTISFDNGLPIVETLQEIQLQVAKVLDMFKSDFES